MKTGFAFFLAMALILVGGGCATMAPYLVDPGVYKSERDVAIGQRQATAAYYKTQTESFKVGRGGVVETRGVKAVPPGEYHDGYLVNLKPESVVITISGPVNLTVALPAAIRPADPRLAIVPVIKPIRLLCNRTYKVAVRRAGGEYPYADDCHWYINSIRGDDQVTGIDADALESALLAGAKLPDRETHVSDFSAYAP